MIGCRRGRSSPRCGGPPSLHLPELADAAHDFLDRIAASKVYVVHDRTVVQPDQPLGPGRDLLVCVDRLSRDGLIDSERQPQPIKPDRVVHHLTPAGRAELDRWLTEPATRQRGYRDDFFLKLMAAVQAGEGEVLDGVLRRQREHLLRELHALSEAKTQRPPSVTGLLITAAELHIRADLGVVDAAEKALEPELRGRSRSAAAGGPSDRQAPARSESAVS
jgi:DNA-binding PadR family transcriptional regulator